MNAGSHRREGATERRLSGLARLEALFGRNATRNRDVLLQHSNTLTEIGICSEPPDLVVFAESEEDVVAAVSICAEYTVPIVPFGAGTSLEGQVNAPHGGVSLDVSRMDGIHRVDATDMTATIGPGVTRQGLDAHLRDLGLFFPVDPGSHCTIGGMISTRASGTNAMRYGTMRENTLGLRVALADGTVVRTGGKARKSAAGYDLTRLFVGAEGTLGIITEATVRLAPRPEAVGGGRASFATLTEACDVVIEAMQLGLCLSRIELMDELQVAACNRYSTLSLPERPTLFVEFHGSSANVEASSAAFAALVATSGNADFEPAMDADHRARLWKARHDGYWAARNLRPGAVAMSTDVCVPISRLAETVAATHADLAEFRLTAPIAGHVGDGNFHALLLIDKDDSDEASRAERFVDRLISRALAVGGTCTGEHGVGQKKRAHLPAEFGEPAIEAMRRLKRAFDPAGIMNPGKILL